MTNFEIDDEPDTPITGVIQCKCVEIKQPIGTFYVGVLDCKDLIEIVYSDIREYKEERLVESISGIQRPLKKNRVVELSKYVNMVDASFPTGVIISMSSKHAKFDASRSTMTIDRGKSVARVLDGQHRIAGLRSFEGDVFQINVTMFIDMEMEDQSLLFSTINLKQTQVDNSLVFDLLEYSKSRSPQRTCHTIARVLNKDNGPFHDRIMILGTATGLAAESLTQAAFVKPLLALMSTEPDQDRDFLKRGKPLKLDLTLVRAKRLVFREMFINERDDEIADVISDYFSAVQRKWPEAWDLRKKGLILNRTTGYRALMRFLPLVIFKFRTSTPSLEQFDSVFAKVTLQSKDFTPQNFVPGSGGEGMLLSRLIANTGIEESQAWKAQKVDVEDDLELKYWAKELGISEDRLKGLVSRHGDSVEQLRNVLNR